MIISLKIENFRSFKEEANFDLRAATSAHLSDNVVILPKTGDRVVRAVGIYGPNASGKSNLLKAFSALSYLVEESYSLKDGEDISCYEPYSLCQKNKSEPVKFEIDFVVNSLKYKYKIHFLKKEILLESLDCFYSKQPSNLFSRDNSGWENIRFGSQFKGGIKKIPFSRNNSYLSKIGTVEEAPEIAKDVYKFFSQLICPIGMDTTFSVLHLEDEKFRELLTGFAGSFLSMVDTGINKVSIVENKDLDIKLPDDMPEEMKRRVLLENRFSYKFGHEMEGGECAEIDIEDESAGTRRLFELTPAIISSLFINRVLIIDEIDHSMHPHLAALLIRLFNDSEVNREGSQLIFTTHNIELMKSDRMRRDQIWFTEKVKGASELYSLDDFDKEKVKSNSPFNKWYDEGRFGGTPTINYMKIKDYFIGLGSEDDDEPDVNVFGDINDIPEDLR
ncbi:AAA family ATPase [Enterobacter quasiroggenkampii]|uniref:AAA family ATPase n=1 Tax=Enterobacter quasiroggenkampii TaxID=2497436 RepID=UPI0021D15FEC|nr:ATP-binding protein [Enterobacter quasiroggenkampii]MCU6383416.1 AAA family ATPase [Enterobacter quasiroggenkampii]MCU6393748.1 AAA family ATPase [Enterobacter quasiroggenkampii]MCU6402390.1 AAA family ATPase [Enterobacter quasiroggenkampii]MCU6415714.1 AAA family ATPase [Enterobacter quasiroggenkampii]